jgi:hypothetical protein
VKRIGIIGIIGTRKRDTAAAFKEVRKGFDEIYEEGNWIVSGGCPKGADRYAEQLAKTEGIPIVTFYPNYKRFKGGAPIIRNGDIADTSDKIIACVMHPEDGIDAVLERKSGGTEDTLKKFVKRTGDKSKIYLV